MNHKISMLTVSLLMLTACGVEMRDKNKSIAPEAGNDLVIEKEFVLPKMMLKSEKVVLHYDRLILQRGGQLITNGANVRIEVGELLSDHGVIRSFREDQKAAAGQQGRSGGDIELVVGKASGSLSLEMRGEGGGD